MEKLDKIREEEENDDLNFEQNFYFKLLNNFIKYHNELNQSTQHMFHGIEYNEKTSTNYSMEEFYKLLTNYKNNLENYPDKLIVLTPDDNINSLKNTDELYELKINGKTMYYSQDIFSLLLLVDDNITFWKILTVR